MAIPTLLANLDESLAYRDRSGIGSLVASGPVRYEPGLGPGSSAYVAEEGTTNYCVNPIPGSTAYYGSVNGSAPVLVTEGDTTWLRATRTGTGFHTIYAGTGNRPAVSASEVWTLSGKCRGNNGQTLTPTFLWRDATAASIGISLGEAVVTDGTEQEWEITATAPAGATDFIMALEDRSGAAIGSTFDLRAIQFEKKGYATSFCPQLDGSGNLLPGYTAAGTLHASATTRATASLTVPYTDPFGEFAVRYSEDWGETWETAFLSEAGVIGSYGTLDLAGDVLTLSAGRAALVDGLLGFGEELTAGQRTALENADQWAWNTLFPKLGGILRVGGNEPLGILRVGGGEVS